MSNRSTRGQHGNPRHSGLYVSLFGAPELSCDGHPVNLPRREARALLYRLSTQSHPVPRDELSFLFWPDCPDAAAHHNLSILLSNLRRALPSPDWLLTTDGAVSLDWSRAQSDVVSFREALSFPAPLSVPERGRWIGSDHSSSPPSRSLGRGPGGWGEGAGPQGATKRPDSRANAVSLVRGSFLAGFSLPGHPEFEAWVDAERSALERLYLETLASLIHDHAAGGDYRSAIDYANRYLAADELAEQTYRHLMALYCLNGERRDAIEVFEHCTVVVERELHLDPSPDTRSVYGAVLSERSPSEVATLAGLPSPDRDKSPLAPDSQLNLPAPLTSFVGRQYEIAHLRQILNPVCGDTRLVTLTGAGGSGKTRLALEVARGLQPEYPDGVWWVDLAPLSEPALVPQAVASALRIKEQGERPLIETLQELLHPRRMLLLLDNCEHLLEACGRLAPQLLSTSPDLRILATSREPLGIRGEAVYRVPGLAVPCIETGVPLALEQVKQADAVRLFLTRARAARDDFELTQENVEAVIRICIGLDGLPLALELAAARLNAFTVYELAARLDERFQILIAGTRAPLARHQTLQAAIDWSYGLLSESERTLLRRLSVFAGGFTREAAQEVCANDQAVRSLSASPDPRVSLSPGQAPDLLAQLVDKSLVVMEPRGEHAHYRLLETIRQYGWERLNRLGRRTPPRRGTRGTLPNSLPGLPSG